MSDSAHAASGVEGVDSLAKIASSRALGAGLLVVLAALPFLSTLFAPLFADDYFHVEVAAKPGDALAHGWVLPIETAGAWWTPPGLSVQYFRPLVVVSFVVDRLLYGTHAAGYHLTNLVIHVTATLLTWAVARRLLGAGFGAWCAGVLFAIHPCHTQAIAWISGRTDALAATAYVAAVLLHIASRPLRPRTAHLLGLSLVFFGLALTAKEMAITLPAVLLLHNLLRPEGESLAKRLVAPALAGAAAVLYLAVRITLLGGFRPPPWPFAYHLGDAGLWAHLLMAPILYLADFTLFVFPDPMVTVPFWKAHAMLFGLFAVVVMATFRGTFLRTRGKGALGWGMGWIAITLLPVATLTVGEHFLYLPSVGYCILVGSQLPRSPLQVDAAARRQLAIVGGLVFAIAMWRTTMFNSVARAGAGVIDDAAAALDRAPSATTVLVANLPAAASLAFPHALRAARPDRDVRTEILSITPKLVPSNEDRALVTFSAPAHLELRRDDGFFGSYIERALLGPRPAFRPGETIERAGYTVTVTDASEGKLNAFAVDLRDPARTLVLDDDTVLAPH